MNGRVARDMFPFYRTCLPALLPLIYFPFFFLFEKKNSLQLAFRYASFLFSFKIRLSYLVTLFSLDTSPRKGERVGRRPPEKFPAFFFFFFFLGTQGCICFDVVFTAHLPRQYFTANRDNFDAGPSFAVPPLLYLI